MHVRHHWQTAHEVETEEHDDVGEDQSLRKQSQYSALRSHCRAKAVTKVLKIADWVKYFFLHRIASLLLLYFIHYYVLTVIFGFFLYFNISLIFISLRATYHNISIVSTGHGLRAERRRRSRYNVITTAMSFVAGTSMTTLIKLHGQGVFLILRVFIEVERTGRLLYLFHGHATIVIQAPLEVIFHPLQPGYDGTLHHLPAAGNDVSQ